MEQTNPVTELELYLIRHGLTGQSDNADLYPEDPLLTPEGVIQARKLGERLSEVDFDAVYSSCMRRTVQTANEIMIRQKREKPLYLDPVFSETRISESAKGTSLEYLKGLCRFAEPADGVTLGDRVFEGNENDTDADIQKRIGRGLETLIGRYTNGEKVAVVMHAGIMTHAAFYLMGFKEKLPEDVDISFRNTCITKIVFFKKGTNPYGSVVFQNMNDTAHLGF